MQKLDLEETEATSSSPTVIFEMNNDKLIKLLYSGESHTVMLLQNGDVYCLGDNKLGQLGVPAIPNSDTFLKSPLTNIKEISCGGDYTIALSYTNQFFFWGEFLSDVTVMKPTVIELPEVGEIKQISAGLDFFAVLNQDGRVYISKYGTKRQPGWLNTAMKFSSLLCNKYSLALITEDNCSVYVSDIEYGTFTDLHYYM